MYRTSVTANMSLIGELFFWYRYRVQCDWGIQVNNGRLVFHI